MGALKLANGREKEDTRHTYGLWNGFRFREFIVLC